MWEEMKGENKSSGYIFNEENNGRISWSLTNPFISCDIMEYKKIYNAIIPKLLVSGMISTTGNSPIGFLPSFIPRDIWDHFSN